VTISFLHHFPVSGQGGNRTPDTRIFSPLLYQLSYLANAITSTRLVGYRGCVYWASDPADPTCGACSWGCWTTIAFLQLPEVDDAYEPGQRLLLRRAEVCLSVRLRGGPLLWEVQRMLLLRLRHG
jgi:hypothetical protein